MNKENRLTPEQKRQLTDMLARLKKVQDEDKAKGITGISREEFLAETEVPDEEYGYRSVRWQTVLMCASEHTERSESV